MARTMIDEVCNGDLATMTREDIEYMGWGIDDVSTEIDRVARVIQGHGMTGEDLSYWFLRHTALRGVFDVVYEMEQMRID